MDQMNMPYLNNELNETRYYSMIKNSLMKYVFFDGKEIRKIDNFPNSEELEFEYNQYIKELKYLFTYRNVEFIRYAFFGIRPAHYDFLRRYKCNGEILEKWVKSQKVDENIFVIQDGTVHVVGNPSKMELARYSILIVDKTEIQLINRNMPINNRFKFDDNFKIPFLLSRYIYFNEKEFCKKDNFPKILERKYNEYICKLKCLYGVFVRFQLAQVIGEYKVITEHSRIG